MLASLDFRPSAVEFAPELLPQILLHELNLPSLSSRMETRTGS
jgi:hypothetical protein